VLSRGSRSFKVIKVVINRKTVCDFLLVIVTDILARIVLKLKVIANCCLNFGLFAFKAPFGGLRLWSTDIIHLGFIGKRVVDFLVVLIELFR